MEPFWSWARGYTYALAGQTDKTREILDGIEHEPANGFPLTIIYAALGDIDEAMVWLESAADVHMPWYPWILGWFQAFRPFHDEPEVIARAQELGIPLLDGPQ